MGKFLGSSLSSSSCLSQSKEKKKNKLTVALWSQAQTLAEMVVDPNSSQISYVTLSKLENFRILI